jgi:uncharacterized protein (TIGR00369 family)
VSVDAPPGFMNTQQMGFSEHIGPLYRSGDPADPASWVFGFRVREHQINRGGVTHGGMLMSFADNCLGETVHRTTRSPCSTISLQVNFAAPARVGDWVECKADITRITRSVVFIRGRVYSGAQTLLDVLGIWKLLAARAPDGKQ